MNAKISKQENNEMRRDSEIGQEFNDNLKASLSLKDKSLILQNLDLLPDQKLTQFSLQILKKSSKDRN